jgi:hypothetical protein
MRAWRDGCGPLEPWFRATPFAAANHYRDRSLPVCPPVEPVGAKRLAAALPRPRRQALWIFDLPAPLELWLAWELRRRWGLPAALAWNGWYDPRGLLSGRDEIPILLTLARRLARAKAGVGLCLLFDGNRQAGQPSPSALDNRYALNEEDAPNAEQLTAIGVTHIRAWSWHQIAIDVKAYVDYLRSRLPVTSIENLARTLQAHE